MNDFESIPANGAAGGSDVADVATDLGSQAQWRYFLPRYKHEEPYFERATRSPRNNPRARVRRGADTWPGD